MMISRISCLRGTTGEMLKQSFSLLYWMFKSSLPLLSACSRNRSEQASRNINLLLLWTLWVLFWAFRRGV